MNPIAILKEVEADVKSFGSISGDIRAKLKSGVADLTAVRDEMNTLVETVMGKAKDALASLKTVADEVSKDTDEDAAGKKDDTAFAADTAPQSEAPPPTAPVVTEAPSGAVVTVDADKGETSHEDATGTVTTVPHDGTAPTAVDAANQPVEPAPAAVAEAVQATADAGVAVPVAQPAI